MQSRTSHFFSRMAAAVAVIAVAAAPAMAAANEKLPSCVSLGTSNHSILRSAVDVASEDGNQRQRTQPWAVQNLPRPAGSGSQSLTGDPRFANRPSTSVRQTEGGRHAICNLVAASCAVAAYGPVPAIKPRTLVSKSLARVKYPSTTAVGTLRSTSRSLTLTDSSEIASSTPGTIKKYFA